MDLLRERNVFGVVTQGSGRNSYVDWFKVQVGPNEDNLEYVKDEWEMDKVSGRFIEATLCLFASKEINFHI